MDNEEVMVRFPDGRVTWMPRETAMRAAVVDMGGYIVERTVKIPKSFEPIKEDPDPVVIEDAPKEEPVKTRKKRGPNKKKH